MAAEAVGTAFLLSAAIIARWEMDFIGPEGLINAPQDASTPGALLRMPGLRDRQYPP